MTTKLKESRRRLGWREFLLSLFIMVVVWATGDLLRTRTQTPDIAELDPAGTVRILFATPGGQDGSPESGSLAAELVTLIDGAQRQVDLAAYNFELENIAEALTRANERGVQVRLITDTDHQNATGPTMLRAAGIPVVTDDQSALMHNKFAVIDGSVVWTGSWNLTAGGNYRQDNNVVVLASTKLARNFTTEFEEMFVKRAFGPQSPDEVPHPRVDLNGIDVETLFASEGNARGHVVGIIEEANRSVAFLAFVLTDDAIARALVRQHRQGIRVSGVVEGQKIGDPGSDFAALRQAGVDVIADGDPSLMHHKVMIVDEATVITGSYNFSASAAEANDENLLVIRSPEVAARFVEEFYRIYEEARP